MAILVVVYKILIKTNLWDSQFIFSKLVRGEKHEKFIWFITNHY